MKKNKYKYILLLFSFSFVPLLAKADPMVTLSIKNPLDINNQITIVAGDDVEVELNVSGTDPDRLLNVRDEIQLVTLDNSVVIAKLVGKTTTGTFNLTVPRDTIDNQLFVRYLTVSGDVYLRVSHPQDMDSIPLFVVEAASLSDVITRVTGLEIAVEEEITTRHAADTVLQSNIDTETSTRDAAIRTERSTRQAADTVLQSNIDAESSARQAADTVLQRNIDAESSTRQAADTVLQKNIAAEITNRESAISAAISTESSTRLFADAALQRNIDSTLQLTATIGTALGTETTARQDADTVLQKNIAAEASARDSAIKQIELTPGPRGPQGYKGSTGARGPQGYRGLQGPQGRTGSRGYTGYTGAKGDKGETGTIRDRVRVTLDCPLNFGITTCIVDCPDGQSALGGGFRLDSIYDPHPIAFNRVWGSRQWLNGWRVSAFIDSKTEIVNEIRVYAICADGSYSVINK